jgi:hypothetical protein
MHYLTRVAVSLVVAGALNATISVTARAADNATSKGFLSFGPDQTIVDIGKIEWQPLKLEGLPPGIASRQVILGKRMTWPPDYPSANSRVRSARATARVPNLRRQPITLSGYQRVGAFIRRRVKIIGLTSVGRARTAKDICNRSWHTGIMPLTSLVRDESN